MQHQNAHPEQQTNEQIHSSPLCPSIRPSCKKCSVRQAYVTITSLCFSHVKSTMRIILSVHCMNAHFDWSFLYPRFCPLYKKHSVRSVDVKTRSSTQAACHMQYQSISIVHQANTHMTSSQRCPSLSPSCRMCSVRQAYVIIGSFASLI